MNQFPSVTDAEAARLNHAHKLGFDCGMKGATPGERANVIEREHLAGEEFRYFQIGFIDGVTELNERRAAARHS